MSRLYEKGQKAAFWKHNKGKNHYLCSNQYGSNEDALMYYCCFGYNPHVFTEQGLYMLMTVLKGSLAVKQSKALIRTFKRMKDYILENRDLIGQREFN